jgi:hypothetical protein
MQTPGPTPGITQGSAGDAEIASPVERFGLAVTQQRCRQQRTRPWRPGDDHQDPFVGRFPQVAKAASSVAITRRGPPRRNAGWVCRILIRSLKVPRVSVSHSARRCHGMGRPESSPSRPSNPSYSPEKIIGAPR